MGNSVRRDTRRAQQAEKQRQALELRKSGATYDEIAVALNLGNKSVAWQLVRAAIRKISREAATEVLALELERLDAVLLGCWPKAKAGDPHAIDRVLRIMDRRAAYLGLDQPKGLKVELDREQAAFLDRLRAGLEPDDFARVLAIATGAVGSDGAGQDPREQGPDAETGDGEPDGA